MRMYYYTMQHTHTTCCDHFQTTVNSSILQELCERPEHDVTSGGPGAMDDCIEKLANVATQVRIHGTVQCVGGMHPAHRLQPLCSTS
jgi:hypothetical protein